MSLALKINSRHDCSRASLWDTYFIRQLFHLIPGSTKGPILVLERCWRSQRTWSNRPGQQFPSSQWALEPFCFFGLSTEARQPLRWRVSAPASGSFGISPARRRALIEHVRVHLHVSERRTCAALGQHRSTQRLVPRGREDGE